MEKLESRLSQKKISKKEWLNEKIGEEINESNCGFVEKK